MTQRALFEGRAIGGPLDGDVVNSRFPAGLVVISRARRLSGVYRFTIDNTFVYQEDNSYVNDVNKLDRVAEEADFDIRSL